MLKCGCGCDREIKVVVSGLVDNADPEKCTPCVRITVSDAHLTPVDIKLTKSQVSKLIYTLQNIRNTGQLT